MESKELLLFFSLLRDALWQKEENLPCDVSDLLLSKIFSLAEKQTVAGLIADTLIRHDVRMTQQWVLEAVGLLELIKQQSLLVSNEVCELHNLFSQFDVNYLVVKGQAVAACYPEPLLRQAGDIDYYCDNANFSLSQVAIKKEWDIEGLRDDSEKHVHFEKNGVTFEGHFDLMELYGIQRNAYWKDLLINDKDSTVNVAGERQIKTLSPTLHVLYVFLHLYHHLMSLGVGLRQFCDLAVVLHYDKEQIDMNLLRRHLKSLGMERAYRACGVILADELGLPEDELGYTLNNLDRKYGWKIMDVVMYRGNMGHYNKQGGFSGWKHKLESIGIKLSHFIKFASLAPSYTCGWLWHEVKRNF